MADIKTLQENIKRRNLLAVSLIAILVTVSFFSLMILFKQQEKDAQTINIAGSQRMLSQKIALLAHQHYNHLLAGIVDDKANESLRNAANLFASNQNVLANLSIDEPSTVPKEVYSLYFNEPIYVNDKVKAYVESAISLSRTRDKIIAGDLIKKEFEQGLVEELLLTLDKVVTKIEQNVNQRVAYIQMFEMSLWLATIVLLIAVVVFIFRPLEQLVKKNYQALFVAKKQSVELNLALNKHAIVYRINMDEMGTILEVNQRFLEFFHYSEQEIIGQSAFCLCGDDYTQEYYEDIFKKCIANEYWHGESINKIKGGRELWLSTTIVPIKSDKDEIKSFIVIQNDISGIKQTELALNKLHQITSDLDKPLKEKIQSILVLGKQIFNLPLALISEIHEQEYQVVYCHTPNDEISPGAKFELGNTYCFHTLQADKPIAFHQAGVSEIKDHPCYQGFGLESYIGVPLIVDGKRFGTLNFSGPETSPKPFSERELGLVQLFAHWISAEFTRENDQNKLLEQQALMEQMGDQARIGAWEVDMVSNAIFWSDMTKEIHEVPSDYQPELSTAINFYKEGESRDRIQALVAESIESGTDYEEELQLITAKGNEVWVSARGRSEFKNGECIRLFGSFQDITAKMVAQQKMAAYSQRMRLAADSVGMGIWEYNLITNKSKWDAQCFRLYGVEPNSYIDSYDAWAESLHPDDRERILEQLINAANGQRKFTTQYRIFWPNGELKYIKAAGILNYDNAQKPISLIGVNYDVTEVVENEIALIKAKDQAEIAATAKNEFFASMSHEIRTPMNGVIGMLDLVKESKLDQDQKHKIGIAQHSAESLLSLINDILDFSKIDANKLELENITFDLRNMVGDLAESFAQQAQQKKLELILDLVDVEESLVKGDSNRIRQILTNLIANAIKFTKQGEVVIRLSQHSHSNSHWKMIVEIIDTGIGISKEKQEELFEVFSQVDASTTREYGGTGLGLAIVKKLCLCMQGNVKVESNEGQGSTFICELIIEKSPDSQSALPAEALQKKRVLIIENNLSCADVIKRQFTCWNIDAELITSAQEALSVLIKPVEKPNYDLVLINRDMPDIEGLAFVKKLRACSAFEHLKIVFMTLMESKNDLADSAQSGINGDFPKPVTTQDLHFALNTLLDSSQQQRMSNAFIPKVIESAAIDDISWMSNVKLLLVEDNRVNQMVAVGLLNKIGIERCIVAVNGKDAIDKLSLCDDNDPFTFVFMDCQMPEMDGYQATKLIRDGEAGTQYQNIPIVAMTANAMVGDKQKCLAAGMDDYLVKPINKTQVCDTLIKYNN